MSTYRNQSSESNRERNARFLWDVPTWLGYDADARLRMTANNWYISDRLLDKRTAADPPPAHWTAAQTAEFNAVVAAQLGPRTGDAVREWSARWGVEMLKAGELLHWYDQHGGAV